MKGSAKPGVDVNAQFDEPSEIEEEDRLQNSGKHSKASNQVPVPLPPSHTVRGKPIPKSTVELRALLKDLSENDSLSWNDLTTQLGKGYRDLSTEDEVMLLHKSLIKSSREGAPRKNIKDNNHLKLGTFGKFQISSHAKYFKKLITLVVTPKKKSMVYKSKDINLLKVAQLNAVCILNDAVELISNELNTIEDRAKVYKVVFLTRAARVKVNHVFHHTMMRTRDGGGMDSKEGLLECRRIYKDELKELHYSNTEHDQLAIKYLTMLDLPSGAKGGRPVLFNVCPTYEKTVQSRVNLFKDGVFSEGEYQTNVGYGVHLSYALLHIMTSVKNKAIIPQKVERSLLVIVPNNILGVANGACSHTISTSQLSYFDEERYNIFKASQAQSNDIESAKLSQVLSEADMTFARDNFVPNDKVKFLVDTVYTQQSRAVTSVLGCLKAVEEVDYFDIRYARGYGEKSHYMYCILYYFIKGLYSLVKCYFVFQLFFLDSVYNEKKNRHEIQIFFTEDDHMISQINSFKDRYCSSPVICESYVSLGIEHFIDAAVFVKKPKKALGDPDAVSQMFTNSRLVLFNAIQILIM